MKNWLISGIALTLVAIGAIVAVAINSGSDEPAESDAPTASLEAFQECLAEQGVNVPAPGGETPFGGFPEGAPPEGGFPEGEVPDGGFPGGQFPEGGPSDETQAAMEACAELMPTPPGGPGEGMSSGVPPIAQN